MDMINIEARGPFARPSNDKEPGTILTFDQLPKLPKLDLITEQSELQKKTQYVKSKNNIFLQVYFASYCYLNFLWLYNASI